MNKGITYYKLETVDSNTSRLHGYCWETNTSVTRTVSKTDTARNWWHYVDIADGVKQGQIVTVNRQHEYKPPQITEIIGDKGKQTERLQQIEEAQNATTT